MDRLAKQQACQLFIEQEIEKGLKSGKTTYRIGREVAGWIEKLFEAKVKPNTIRVRADRRICTNVHSDSTYGNNAGIRENQEIKFRHGGVREGAGRPPKFSVSPPGGDWYQSSEWEEWETPQWLFDLLDSEFHFDCDVAASKRNHKCKKYFSKKDDGLSQKWWGTCFMNPPDSSVGDWIGKAKNEVKNGITTVCLVAARTEADWWWETCTQGEVRFLRRRLGFNGYGVAPFSSAVIVLGPNIRQKVIWWDVDQRKKLIPRNGDRFWLTPPHIYARLNDEFHFDFDPCPYPLPENYDSLSIPWGSVNFVNPPFCEKDGPHGAVSAFVHKAIEEQAKGKTSVLLLPVRNYINLLMQAGAELRPMGRIPWLEVDTKEPRKAPDPTLCAILRPARLSKTGRKREKPLTNC